MAANPLDEEIEICFNFPLHVILLSPSGNPDEDSFDNKGAVFVTASGNSCLPVFTDNEKPGQFIAAHTLPEDAKAVAFQYPDSFIRFLESVNQSGGATHIAFDPCKDSVSIHPTIVEIVQQLKMQFENMRDILEPLFAKACATDEFEYACNLIRMRAPMPAGWDPLEESNRLLSDIFTLLHVPLMGETKIRFGLLMYCHIIEMSAPYDMIGNMLQICVGERYTMRGLFPKRFYPYDKIKKIKEWAEQAGFPNVGTLFDRFFDKEIRNAFSHSDYVIHGDDVNLIDGKVTRRIPIKSELWPKISNAYDFWLTFANLWRDSRMAYKEPKNVRGRFGPAGQIVDISLIADSDNGLRGFRSPPEKDKTQQGS